MIHDHTNLLKYFKDWLTNRETERWVYLEPVALMCEPTRASYLVQNARSRCCPEEARRSLNDVNCDLQRSSSTFPSFINPSNIEVIFPYSSGKCH